MSFGFSAGDIITGLVLIKNVIDALNESTGSKADFKALLGTLKSLENAFRICVLVYQQCDELQAEHQVQMDAKVIHQQLLNENEQCKKILEDFLGGMSHYINAFADDQSKAVALTRHVRKITWLSHKSDVGKLERDLKGHLNSLQLCAAALCHLYLTANTKIASSTESKVDAILSNMTDLRAEVTTIFASVQTGNSRNTSGLGNIWEGTSAQLDIVILHDAINRTIPLPMMLLYSRTALHKLVLWMYHDRDMPGRAKVQRKEYTITDEDADGALIEESNWNTIYHPGKHLSLNMVFPASKAWNPSFCPRCNRPAMGKILPGERRRCVMCQLTFRIFDKERLIEDVSASESEGTSGAVSTNVVDASGFVQQKNDNNSPGEFEDSRKLKVNKDELFFFQNIHYHRDILIKKTPTSSEIVTEEIHRKFGLDELPPLHRAAACGNLKEVADLIDGGIDVDMKIPFSMRDDDRWEFYGATPLLLAAWFGKLKVIEMLIEKGANVNALDRGHAGILSHAIHGPCRGRIVMPLLSTYGADPNIEDCWGRLPLHDAAQKGLHFLIHPLVERGNGLDHQDRDGHSPLHFAASCGNEETVIALLELGADATICENTINWTPLHSAAYGGAEAVIDILYQEIPHLNAKDKDGNTAIHLAVQKDYVTVIEVLLKNGADIECRTVNGETPLFSAAKYGRERSTKLLISAGADVNAFVPNGFTPLYYASVEGHPSVVNQLLAAGARSMGDKYGGLPLHYVAFQGGTKLVELLLRYEPDMINIPNKNQHTALHFAASRGHLHLASLLLERGSDVEAKSDMGLLSLHHAAFYGRELIVQLLLEHGPNTVNTGTNDGATALHFAAGEGHLDLMRLLLERGSDVEAKSDIGSLSLHHAAFYGRELIVQLLLEHGPNTVNTRDSVGTTALHWAVWQGHLSTTKILLINGSDLEIRCENGRTALFRAVLKGWKEITEFLLQHESNIKKGLRDNEGASPWDIENSSLLTADMIHLLVSHGWSVDEQYCKGRTALHTAVFDSNEEAARSLISHGCSTQVGDADGDTPLDIAILMGNHSMETLIRDAQKSLKSASQESGLLEA